MKMLLKFNLLDWLSLYGEKFVKTKKGTLSVSTGSALLHTTYNVGGVSYHNTETRGGRRRLRFEPTLLQ